MTKARILIVEDELIVAQDLKNRLRLLGYDVVDAALGAQAVMLADKLRPDLVLMDIRLEGEMDGIVAAERIRRDFRLPIVFLTAYSEEDTIKRAKVVEPFGYIIKPFEDREIRSTIEIALYKHQAEKKLRESERRYATTLASIGDGVIATDALGGVTFLNPVAERLTGWSLAEADGRPLKEVFRIANEQTRQAMEDPVARVLREGRIVGLANHTILITRDGREIPIDDCAAPILDDSEATSGAVLVFQDVTERRRKEAELRRIEWMLSPRTPAVKGAWAAQRQGYGDLTALNASRLILDAVGPGLLSDIVGDFLDLLETAAAVYERNGDYAFSIFSSGWCRFMDQASRNGCRTPDNRTALDSGRWHCHESCWTEASKQSMERAGPVDIACRGGIRRYALPIRAGDEIVGSINFGYGDPPRDPTRLQGLAERYGVSPEELGDVARAYESRPNYIIDLAKRRLEVSARLIGEIVERKRAEQEREQALALLQAAVAQSPSGILIADAPDGAIRWANSAALAIRGQTDLPLTGIEIGRHASNWQTLRPDGSVYISEELPLSRAILKGEITRDEEVIIRNGQGEDRWVSVNAAPIRNQEGAITSGIVVFHDITERKQAEEERNRIGEQLVQAQKMESVGRLAGGVAHDFNNMLAAILGHAELGMLEVSQSDPVHRTLKDIKNLAQRSAELTRQLLAFARRQTIAPKILDLNDTVAGMLKMLQRLIGEDIDLLWKPGSRLWSVRIDPSQIDQILANLCVNARDAIAGVGKLTIETENTVLDEIYCAVHPGFLCGQYVMLAVSDDGHGIEKDILEHIFEPFFTTKEVGKGTGLGLATVYGIVKQNNGFINVCSKPGEGTTFRIYLPRHADKAEQLEAESTGTVPLGQGETVLIVEDESAILNLGKAILERLGYTLLTAATPSAAMRLAETHADPIDVLITDVVMPEMNGRELAERISPIHPGMKILFMSGYTADVIAHQGVLDEGINLIQKPFSMRDLAVKVREVLGKGQEG